MVSMVSGAMLRRSRLDIAGWAGFLSKSQSGIHEPELLVLKSASAVVDAKELCFVALSSSDSAVGEKEQQAISSRRQVRSPKRGSSRLRSGRVPQEFSEAGSLPGIGLG